MPSGSVGTTSATDREPVTVSRVLDGDTIEALTPDGPITVRLVGINAPESDECYGETSSRALQESIGGAAITLDPVGIDQFDRLLARVFVEDQHVNLDLVRRGLAIATSSGDDPNRDTLISAEEDAYEARVGLWAPDACGPGGVTGVGFDTQRSVFDPAGRDEERLGEEVIVIVNEGDERVVLAGWTLRDESSLHRLTFDEGAFIDPGGSLAVGSDDPRWDPGASPVWNNGGDMALLQDATGNVIGRWRY